MTSSFLRSLLVAIFIPLFSGHSLLGIEVAMASRGSSPASISDTQKSELIDRATKEEVRKTLNVQTRLAKGGWTSGGGEGLACFENKEEKEKSFDKENRISEEGRAKIKKIYLLDAWEFSQKYRPYPPLVLVGGERKVLGAYDYLIRRLEDYFKIAPYFIYRIQESILIIRDRQLNSEQGNSNWEDIRPLPKLEDSGPVSKPIPEQCQRVQLAVRYAKSHEDGTHPLVFVDQDGGLMQQIRERNNPVDAVFFEAGLILHEALYMAAVELGAENSAQIREMTMLLLSSEFINEIRSKPTNEQMMSFTDKFVTYGFLNIMKLFVPSSVNGPSSYEKNRLVDASKSLTEKHRQAVKKFEDMLKETGRDIKSVTPNEYSGFVFNEMLNSPRNKLLPIEALLQSAYNEWNMGHLGSDENLNVQRIFLPDVDPRPILKFVCGFLATRTTIQSYHREYAEKTGDMALASRYEPVIKVLNDLNHKALIYCISEDYVSLEEVRGFSLTGK